MRRALVLAAVTALAMARPETYREKEDFQYSRSSSDDGTKSGFYGAQRGNMGGNYERSHNMDSLAQHQMGGLVRNVEGELGDGATQKSGSVFTAANSRGVFGSGHYDLSNLEGRNFQEGTSFGDSQSQSSLSSSYRSTQNSDYGRQSQAYLANSGYGSQSQNSRYNGYRAAGNSDQALYASNTQSADNLQLASQYEAAHAGHSGYHSQSGYQGHSAFNQAASSSDLSNGYGSNVRLGSGSPVRLYVRPGTTVMIPIAAQTYDTSRGTATTFDQNAINSEAEVLGTNTQQGVYKPSNNAKHYESSYSYRKQWEKHDTKPVSTIPESVPIRGVQLAVPTVNPYPSNSELYEDTQSQGSAHQHEASGQEAQNVQSSSQHRGYNVKTGSSHSRQAYNSVHEHGAATNTAATSQTAGSSAYTHGGYNHGASANLNSANFNNQVEDIDSKPKSYQSSYSYHKSWEHQGDPYVIKPATNGVYTTADTQASQKLTAASLNQGASNYGSHQYGAHYHQGQQGYSSVNAADCDEHGHLRVARSYNLGQHDKAPYQQSDDIYEGQENMNQEPQNLEDFGQQSQNINDFGQQSQNLEDLGQQSQNLEDLGQQSQNLEDLGQQSQNLEDLGQQSQNLEDLGQQSQNLEDLGQQSQKHEDLGQQTQNLQDFGQQSQNMENLGHQSQNLDDLGQLSQNLENFGQQSENLEDLGQQTQNLDQQTQSQWDQQSQTDLGQQTQNTWSTLETIQHGKDTEKLQNEKDQAVSGYNPHHTNTDTVFQTQENGFEINHPSTINSQYQPESHTTQEDSNKPNPFAHITFHEHSRDKENTDLHETQNMYHETSYYGNNFPPYVNQDNQNVYTVPLMPVDWDKAGKEQADWQQNLNAHHIHINTGYGYQHNINKNTGYSPWMMNPVYSNNQQVPNYDFENHGYGSSVNSYDKIQTHYTRNDHSTHTSSNIHLNNQESGSTSLTNLWNLLDNIEKETISENGTNSFDSSNFFQENKENVQYNNNSELNFNQHSLNTQSQPAQANALITSTENKKLETTTKAYNKIHAHDVDTLERGDIGPEKKRRPEEDVGRGDIGPDDSSSENSYAPNRPLEKIESKIVLDNSKPYKTLEELETLSFSKENNNTTTSNTRNMHEINSHYSQNVNKKLESELSVLGLHEQKQLNVNHSELDNWKLQNDVDKTVSTTSKSSTSYVHQNFNIEQGPEDIIVEDPNQQSENLGQEVENLNQQINDNFRGFEFDQNQQNLDHQIVDFGQQSENLGQDLIIPQFDNFNKHINLDHKIVDFGQQNENLGQNLIIQQFDNFNQHTNLDHKIVDFGQPIENLGQEQIKPQFDNFNQHENLDHKIVDLGQQTENLEQKNIEEKFENVNQPNGKPNHHGLNLEHGPDDIQQHNMDQQFETLGQQSENLGQQSLNEFNVEGQQNENLGPGQQLENFGQQSEDSFQHETIPEFGQHEQFQQESLSEFDHQNENLEQHSQNEHPWKPNKYLNEHSHGVETFVEPAHQKEEIISHYNEPVAEPEIVTQKISKVDAPPEPVTGKTGFWSKVGSKFSSAKEKVSSWFSRS